MRFEIFTGLKFLIAVIRVSNATRFLAVTQILNSIIFTIHSEKMQIEANSKGTPELIITELCTSKKKNTVILPEKKSAFTLRQTPDKN